MIIASATCICVNMFIIISGYFGIKLRFSSIVRLCLQLVMIYVPFYLIGCCIPSLLPSNFEVRSFLLQFFVISNGGYFIQCYFMLMILSPVLNSFVEKYGKACIKWVVVFFLLEAWFSCVMNVENLGYNRGYSLIHFTVLYMIARCIKLYEDEIIKVKPIVYVLGYILCTGLICLMYIGGISFARAFSNPVVVCSAVFSFLPFLYRPFYNKTVNWIAGGTLAVYVIQVTHPVLHLLRVFDTWALDTYRYPIYLILVAFSIFIVFFSSVLYGRMCLSLITPIVQRLNNKMDLFGYASRKYKA